MSRLPRLFGIALAVAAACPVVFAVPPAAEPAMVPGAAPGAAPAAAPGAAPADPGAAAPGAPAAPAAPPVVAPADQTLVDNVKNFFHYILIARYDMGNAQAQQMLGRDFKEVLPQMEAEATSRGIGIDEFLDRRQNVPELKDSITAIKTKLNEARFGRKGDPAWIEQQIKRLSTGERGYANGMIQLRQSGELAVPQMLDILKDTAQREHHASILKALKDMGRSILNPLVAATETKDQRMQIILADLLADLKFPETLPYLLKIVEDKDTPQGVRTQVSASIVRMGGNLKARSGDLFHELAERGFYYHTSLISYDPRNPAAYYWTWDTNQQGLVRKDVPAAAWHDVMAMRAAELAMKGNGSQDSVSLWLAANNRRETDLKEGESSNVFADTPAHFWNVRLGTQYANNVLARAMNDRTTAVALKVVKSMQTIAGQSNIPGEAPLIQAMRYPDRRVRYEAAIAMGSSLPTRPFAGQDRVVLLLAEAISQTGRGGVLVLAPSDSAKNEWVTGLKANYAVAGATTANAALAESNALPSVDAIVFSEDVNPTEIMAMLKIAAETPRMERAAKVVMVKSAQSGWFRNALNDQSLMATTAGTGEPLIKAIDEARTKAAGTGLSEADAKDVAIRAANVLGDLAIGRNGVLDLSTAERTLLGALNDPRPEIVKAVANVLGRFDSKVAQMSLVDKGVDPATAEDAKTALYKGVAQSAKIFGNRLDAGRIESLRKAVSIEGSQETKNAVAEAIGALNLPIQQVKSLILERTPAGTGVGAPAATPAAPAAPAAPAPGAVPGAPAAPAPGEVPGAAPAGPAIVPPAGVPPVAPPPM